MMKDQVWAVDGLGASQRVSESARGYGLMGREGLWGNGV
jgi:hypothetical protein